MKMSKHAIYRFANRCDDDVVLQELGNYYRPRSENAVKETSRGYGIVVKLMNELISNSAEFGKSSDGTKSFLYHLDTGWLFIVDNITHTVVSCYIAYDKKVLVESILAKRSLIHKELASISLLTNELTSSMPRNVRNK